MNADDKTPLKILHVYRSPVGGLFRHVMDLAEGQIARGHHVGMIVSSLTGGQRAEDMLSALAPKLKLGITRIPMHRPIHPADALGAWHVTKRISETNADVIHGHGAKGGAFARLAPASRTVVRAYTPHGGSLLFGHDTLGGKIYLTLERILMMRPTLYLFESAYSETIFRDKIGNPSSLVRVVHNGVSPKDFDPAPINADATDLIFLGELRPVKGIDILFNALAQLKQEGRTVTLSLAGGGPSGDELRAQAAQLGIDRAVTFKGIMNARDALACGRIMVVPSRAESLPYVVLEAAAAGKPLITTRVGGIPEIFGPLSDQLVPPQDAPALARSIAKALDEPDVTQQTAQTLRKRVSEGFSTDTMVDQVLAAYHEAIAQQRD